MKEKVFGFDDSVLSLEGIEAFIVGVGGAVLALLAMFLPFLLFL